MSKISKKRKPVEGEETEEELRAIRRKNEHEQWLRSIGAKRPSKKERLQEFFALCSKQERQFFKSHGDFLQDGHFYIFADGARIAKTSHGFGTQYEPSTDEHQRAKQSARYFSVKESRARTRFRDYQQACVSETGVFAESNFEEREAKLKKLQSAARTARKELDVAKQLVKDTEPFSDAVKKREEAEERQRKADHKDRVKNMKI